MENQEPKIEIEKLTSDGNCPLTHKYKKEENMKEADLKMSFKN